MTDHPTQTFRGRLAAIADNARFQRVIIVLIVVNAITLGLETSPEIMASAGLLSDDGAEAGGGDLVIAVRAENAAAAESAMAAAAELLDAPASWAKAAEVWRPRTLR